jgi:hypothetical protein
MSGQDGDYRRALVGARLRVEHLQKEVLRDQARFGVQLAGARLALAALEVCQEHAVEGLVFDRMQKDKVETEARATG